MTFQHCFRHRPTGRLHEINAKDAAGNGSSIRPRHFGAGQESQIVGSRQIPRRRSSVHVM